MVRHHSRHKPRVMSSQVPGRCWAAAFAVAGLSAQAARPASLAGRTRAGRATAGMESVAYLIWASSFSWKDAARAAPDAVPRAARGASKRLYVHSPPTPSPRRQLVCRNKGTACVTTRPGRARRMGTATTVTKLRLPGGCLPSTAGTARPGHHQGCRTIG